MSDSFYQFTPLRLYLQSLPVEKSEIPLALLALQYNNKKEGYEITGPLNQYRRQ